MSQALYLREFLETYDDEVPIFYYLLTQPFETKETTIFSLLHTTPIPFLLLNLLYQHNIHKEYYLQHFLGTIHFLGFTQA